MLPEHSQSLLGCHRKFDFTIFEQTDRGGQNRIETCPVVIENGRTLDWGKDIERRVHEQFCIVLSDSYFAWTSRLLGVQEPNWFHG